MAMGNLADPGLPDQSSKPVPIRRLARRRDEDLAVPEQLAAQLKDVLGTSAAIGASRDHQYPGR
jgi:hypothetical protein